MWRRLINIFEKDMCISYLMKKSKSNSKAFKINVFVASNKLLQLIRKREIPASCSN